MNDFRLPLGAKVKDIITGLEGIIVGQTRYITGCDRFSIQRKLDKDNNLPDWISFDDNQLVMLDDKPIVLPSLKTKEIGGPLNYNPKHKQDPIQQ